MGSRIHSRVRHQIFRVIGENGQFQWTVPVPTATIFYTDEIMTLIDSVCCRYVKILYENKSIFRKRGIKGVIELFF